MEQRCRAVLDLPGHDRSPVRSRRRPPTSPVTWPISDTGRDDHLRRRGRLDNDVHCVCDSDSCANGGSLGSSTRLTVKTEINMARSWRVRVCPWWFTSVGRVAALPPWFAVVRRVALGEIPKLVLGAKLRTLQSARNSQLPSQQFRRSSLHREAACLSPPLMPYPSNCENGTFCDTMRRAGKVLGLLLIPNQRELVRQLIATLQHSQLL